MQRELNEIKVLWNLHPIRKTNNDQLAHGRPLLMFTSPGEYETHDYLRPVSDQYVEGCWEECTPKSNIYCDHDLNEMCLLLMHENGWQNPHDSFSGYELYVSLREILLNLL